MTVWKWVAICVVLACLATWPAFAEPQENRIWITWEHRQSKPELCEEKGHCTPVGHYITRLADRPDTSTARNMIGAMDSLAKTRNQPVEHPDAPLICQNVNAMTVLGFDPESWDMSEKDMALRDLPGVHFSVSKLKAPEGYDGPFGEQLQAEMEQKFRNAGIPVFNKEEMKNAPGQPQLNIYSSNTNPDTGCWFSVFASLSQTVLLTRNHTVKLKAGTWGMSGGFSAEHPNRSEYDAIMLVVDNFIADYWKANSGVTKNN